MTAGAAVVEGHVAGFVKMAPVVDAHQLIVDAGAFAALGVAGVAAGVVVGC